MKKVSIYGAGMSGMTAAVNLARDGFEVEVFDREPGYGGSRLYNLNLFYSIRHVSRQALARYEDLMRRHEGVELREWEYVSGAVPLGSPDNPSLFRGDLIMCGTISGAMDPMMWFGILGAIMTGKIAAMAVVDREKAEAEFQRFTRRFRAAYWLKNQVFYRVRPHVGAMEKAINTIGVTRVEKMVKGRRDPEPAGRRSRVRHARLFLSRQPVTYRVQS